MCSAWSSGKVDGSRSGTRPQRAGRLSSLPERSGKVYASARDRSFPLAKILIVDDEPQILQSTRMLLEAVGHSVLTSTDHRQTLAVLRDARPDLLLQDVRMPGLDIAEFVAALRADPEASQVAVILFSASLSLAELYEEVGVIGYLEKPFRPADLFAAIESAIARRGEDERAPLQNALTSEA